MVKYILNKFHDLTKKRFWKYRESGNEILFCLLVFGLWLTTVFVNNVRKVEFDGHDWFFLSVCVVFLYETVLKEKR